MKLTTVKVKIYQGQKNIIYLPAFIIKNLQIPINKEILICFGLTSKKKALVKAINKSTNEIYMTTSLKKNLMLPFCKNILIKKEDNSLIIGPAIGILTTDLSKTKFSNNSLNTRGFFFKNLLEPEQYYPVFYFVFTPDNINWTKKTINAFFYENNKNGKKTWHKYVVPFPDVVYNRIPNRSSENFESVKRFKERYVQMGGKLFNYRFFNKWEMSKMLSSSDTCTKYLPETYINPRYDVFNTMIKKHKIIYLKPANGSLGLGIYKIINKGNSYILKYRLKSKNISLTFNKTSSIYHYVFSNKSSKNYLIQQGINLIEYNNSPVDFRIHLNKDINNQWKVVAIGAKAAGKNSVTTHLRTGGKLLDSTDFLKYKYNKDAEEIIKRINSISIKIAETTEEKIKKPLGELGLDIGIDKKKRIWLFEVNSKPGRSIFKYPKLKKSAKESSKQLANYAMYLAGFSEKSIKSKEDLK